MSSSSVSLSSAKIWVPAGTFSTTSSLAAPVRSLTPGMGFSVLIESFIVTVIGGMGSILGALIGALLLGLIRSYGSLGFPLFTEGLMYLFMVIVLVSKPTGLFGKEAA